MAYPSLLHVQITVDLLFQEFTIESFATFFEHAPESPLFEEWVGVLDRLGINGYREAVLAACGFCMFDALVDADGKLVELYQTLLDVAKGVERSPPSLPHKGSSDPCYNFVYGLYAVCIATSAVPNLEDIGRIYGRILNYGNPILLAFRDWCDQSVAVRKCQVTKLHLPQILRIIHGVLAYWDQPGQNTLPVQVVIGIERWNTEMNIGLWLSRYRVGQNPYKNTIEAGNQRHHDYNLVQQQNGHGMQGMQAANPPDSDDPFTTQAAPAAVTAPRRKRRAPRRAPKKLSAPKVEEDEEGDAHFEFEEQDDANDGDYKE